jgi:hypothetical protein
VRAELQQIREWLTRFGERLPTEFRDQLTSLSTDSGLSNQTRRASTMRRHRPSTPS